MPGKDTSSGVNKSSGEITSDSIGNSSKGKMGDKIIDYAAMGAEIAQTLTAANGMSTVDVKKYQGKIYNLFKSVEQPVVDFGVTAYFLVNDPSANADWGKANPIIIGGVTVAAVEIAGGVISMAQGDGLLRKFLSSAYERLVPKVIKHVPGVAESLNARAAKHGVTGADPIAVVSWVRGIYPETQANAGTRALLRNRATAGRSDVQVIPGLGGDNAAAPAAKNTGSTQEYYM